MADCIERLTFCHIYENKDLSFICGSNSGSAHCLRCGVQIVYGLAILATIIMGIVSLILQDNNEVFLVFVIFASIWAFFWCSACCFGICIRMRKQNPGAEGCMQILSCCCQCVFLFVVPPGAEDDAEFREKGSFFKAPLDIEEGTELMSEKRVETGSLKF